VSETPAGGPDPGKLRMSRGTSVHTVWSMQTFPQAIPTDAHVRTLQRQHARLERHLERCRAAVAACELPNPPLGRELDDAHALLARVRAELASLGR
jgi:hypothetical protein